MGGLVCWFLGIGFVVVGVWGLTGAGVLGWGLAFGF